MKAFPNGVWERGNPFLYTIPVVMVFEKGERFMFQINKKQWWNQLDETWKKIFKEAIDIDDAEPTDSDLEKIVNLQELACQKKQLSDLKPLRALTNLQKLNCHNNQIRDLEPLGALTNLQELTCWENQISDKCWVTLFR